LGLLPLALPGQTVGASKLEDLVIREHLTAHVAYRLAEDPTLRSVVLFRATAPMVFHEDSVLVRQGRVRRLTDSVGAALRALAPRRVDESVSLLRWRGEHFDYSAITGDSLFTAGRRFPLPRDGSVLVILFQQSDPAPDRWNLLGSVVTAEQMPRLFWSRAEPRGDRIVRIDARDRPRLLEQYLRRDARVRALLEAR
jgi:hypothetical protein